MLDALSSDLTDRILAHLGCARKSPSIRYLNQLIHAYIRRVPWESVSRIVKRCTTVETAQCPRWPAEFWTDALSCGTGGTCFENNLAFFALLTALGYTGYLTINDMSGQRACHTAIIILGQQQKHLVDVAIPLHGALPLYRNKVTRRSTSFHHYTIRPSGDCQFAIQRSHHPKRDVFTLLDSPAPPEVYAAAVEGDYEPTGYFLDRVIIVKMIDDRLWRFSSVERPYKLEAFTKTSRQEILLAPDRLSYLLAQHFGIAEEKVAAALSHVV